MRKIVYLLACSFLVSQASELSISLPSRCASTAYDLVTTYPKTSAAAALAAVYMATPASYNDKGRTRTESVIDGICSSKVMGYLSKKLVYGNNPLTDYYPAPSAENMELLKKYAQELNINNPDIIYKRMPTTEDEERKG